MIVLSPLREFRFPVMAECISPDVFEGKTPSEIGALQMWEGNKQKSLESLFKIEEATTEETAGDATLQIVGDIRQVRRIGSGMKKGTITIKGDVGMHLGEEMKGGKIIVQGDAESWVGSMMKGGSIEILGNAGDYLAAPYRGCDKGMKSGKIIVHGNVGTEAGAYMQSGVIKILGNAGEFTGFRMHDGTIYVKGDCMERAGACMANGKVVIEGRLESVLPSFSVDSIRPKIKIDTSEEVEGPLYVFVGDLAENGSGKLYVSKKNNPQLSCYEKFL